MVYVSYMFYKICYVVDSLIKKLNNCIYYYYCFYLEFVFIYRYDIYSIFVGNLYFIFYSNDIRDGYVIVYFYYMWRIYILFFIFCNKINM